MKALIIGLTLLTSFSVLAETLDLRTATTISCQSEGLGSFHLANLQSKAVIIAATSKNIKITERTKNSIGFTYKDFKGYNFKMVFDKIVQHEDGSGNLYIKLSGAFVNGDIESPIECVAE